MNQITRWNPFASPTGSELPAAFDDFLRGFGLQPAWRELGQALPSIRIDVSEDDKAYTVKADLPGVRKEDIEVSVEGRQVEISAEMSKKVEKKGSNSLYTERTEGQVYRSFTLPREVDGKAVEARYDGGVLTLSLPKKPNGKSQKIKVG